MDDDSDDDDRRGGKGDMGDDFIDWSEDKDRIILTGADGSMLYIEMGATKIAASLSAAAIAAMTLWWARYEFIKYSYKDANIWYFPNISKFRS